MIDFGNNKEYLKMEKSDDLVREAIEPGVSKAKAVKLIKQALEIWPENEYARMMLIVKQNKASAVSDLRDLEKEMKIKLQEEGFFKPQKIGHFWGIMETRDYMRVKYNIMTILIDKGRYDEAIIEAKELLKLSQDDNLGVRYFLAFCYVTNGDRNTFESFLKSTKEDSINMWIHKVAFEFLHGGYEDGQKMLKKFFTKFKDIKEANVFEKLPYFIVRPYHEMFGFDMQWNSFDIILNAQIMYKDFLPSLVEQFIIYYLRFIKPLSKLN